jgi:flagellar biosynthesis protein FlhA
LAANIEHVFTEAGALVAFAQEKSLHSGMNRFSRWQDLVLPVMLIASVFVILVPMPVGVMDVLLSANITVSLIVLLTTIYVQTPLEFSIFPSLLLATTLGRLVLNVASTRLILSQGGTNGLDAAGGVIR